MLLTIRYLGHHQSIHGRCCCTRKEFRQLTLSRQHPMPESNLYLALCEL